MNDERRTGMGAANRLTLARIALTPPLAAVMLWRGPFWEAIAFAMLAAAAFTDLLDGYLARRRNQITELGTLLDPIADKFLISTVFVCLVAADLAPAWIAIVIIGREFAVTALRMTAIQRGARVPVRFLGKAKMHAQVYAALAVLLGSAYPWFEWLGVFGLWVAAGLTIWSAFDYFARSWRLVVTG